MEDCALYYPYIKVPKSVWLTRVLLYWDKIGAIVPYEYLDDSKKLGSYMLELVKAELVVQVSPGMYLYQVPNFSKAFLEYLDGKLENTEKGNKKQYSLIHQEKLGISIARKSIHMEKLHDLGEELCIRGLARHIDSAGHSPWYEVESQTADEFMAYLAGVLGQLKEGYMPITDQRTRSNPFFKTSPAEKRKNSLLEVVLKEILPGPSYPISPIELIDFKSKHQNLLKEFRSYIDKKVLDWSIIENDLDREMYMRREINLIKEEVNNLADLMKGRKWPRITFGNFCAIFASGVSALQAIKQNDLSIGLLGATLSLAPAVYDAFQNSRIKLVQKPLTYAVLSTNRFQRNP